eukprot:GEMP01031221.1.p1 GENE.GEMP01031221.1~~GEMP01031221.1.p1  ORF type:complete len:405 (+),score=87.56 GEMP01031221.1:121-1335(+)
MEYFAMLIWVVRFLLPIVIFGYFWQKNMNGHSNRHVKQVEWRNVYNRRHMLSYRSVEHEVYDEDLRQILMKVKDIEELSATVPSVRKQWRAIAKRRSYEKRNSAESKLDEEERKQCLKEKNDLMVESLVNYLSFNPREKRQYIPDKPPPAPAPMRELGVPGNAPTNARADKSAIIDNADSDIQLIIAAKSNDEAVRVLRGALVFKKISVVHRLYQQLTEAAISIKEETFLLMVQIAVIAKDMRAAADYLMLMEAAGFQPPTSLLNSVMALYSASKKEEEVSGNASEKQKNGPTTFGLGSTSTIANHDSNTGFNYDGNGNSNGIGNGNSHSIGNGNSNSIGKSGNNNVQHGNGRTLINNSLHENNQNEQEIASCPSKLSASAAEFVPAPVAFSEEPSLLRAQMFV